MLVTDSSHYATWLKASGTTSAVIRVRLCYLNRLAVLHPGKSIETFTIDDLLHFLSRPGWAPETRRSARSAVRSYFRWAYSTGRIAHDLSIKLPAVRIPPTLPRPTPDDVFQRALARAGHRDQLMILLAAYAGLRRAEISRVHSKDIVGDVLRVCGKGGRVREIPLHPELQRRLRDCKGWAFPGKDDGHLSPNRVGTILIRLLGEGWSGHTLRHRFATRAYAVERDLFAVQTLLGHSKPETTRRYTAIPNESLRTAVLGAA